MVGDAGLKLGGKPLCRSVLPVVLLLGLLSVQPPPVAHAQGTTIRAWSNDYFSSDIVDPTLVIGSFFTIGILAENLPPILNITGGGINGFDFTIGFNSQVLNATEFDWRAPLCPSSEGCLFDTSSSILLAQEVEPGNVRLAVVLLGMAVEGSGALFRIRFQVVGNGGSLLNIQENVSVLAGIVNGSAQSIPYEGVDGSFSNLTSGQAPVAIFTHSPLNASELQPVLFDASASYDPDSLNATNNGIVSYSWDFGDGTVVRDTQPIIYNDYVAAGTYIVTLFVTDHDGLQGSVSDTVFVQPRLAHNLAISSLLIIPSNVTVGDPVTAQVTIENDGADTEFSVLNVLTDGVPVAVQAVAIGPELPTVVDVRLETTGLLAGFHRVTVSMDPVPGESQLYDNTAIVSFFVNAPSGSFRYTRLDLPNQFIDGGVALNERGDDLTFFVQLPFVFPFYGNSFTGVWASTNGLITLFGPDGTFSNSASGLAGKFAIAPLWDDLLTFVRAGDDVYTLQLDPSHFMIRWKAEPIYNQAIEVNFEAVLGADGTILFNYGPSGGQVTATVGISNGSGDSIVEDVSFADRRESILFTPSRAEHDVAVVLQAPSFVPSGGSALITAAALNHGTSDEVNVTLELQIDGSQVNSTVLAVLPVSTPVTSQVSITFLWTPETLGDHTVRAMVSVVPGEESVVNNEASAIASVREPLIHPVPGQYAEYLEAVRYPDGSVQTVEVRIEYGEYVGPELIRVTVSVYNGYNDTYSQLVNVFTRQVSYQSGNLDGFWEGWIETNIDVGSVVTIGYNPATVEAREPFVTPLGLVDAWRLRDLNSPDFRIFYDRLVGVLVGFNQTFGGYSVSLVITETNIPLTTLRIHRVTVEPDRGPVETMVTVSGSDAAVGDSFEIRWDGQLLGTVYSDQLETFTFSFRAPLSPAGPHTITVTDLVNGFPARATFTIVPSLSLDPVSGPVGTLVLVQGTGMPAFALVQVEFDSQTMATLITDETGSFSGSLLVPFAEPGDHLVQAMTFLLIQPVPGTPFETMSVSRVFTVVDQTPLVVVADTGAVYFSGDNSDVYVQVAFHGVPVDATSISVRLVSSNGTYRRLPVSRIGTGLYKASYPVPGTTGTFLLQVEASYQTHSIDSMGSTIEVFEVKPAWLSDRTRTMVTVTGSIVATMTAAGAALYFTRRKQEDTATLPF